MEWIQKNIITLLLLLGSLAVSWGMMNARVDAIMAKVDQYPSQDWFTLKFENVDGSLKEVNKKLDAHLESAQKSQQANKDFQADTRRYEAQNPLNE